MENFPRRSCTDEERRLLEREHLSAGQIRFRRALRSTFGDRTPQEFAETDVDCFLLSGRPVFDTAAIDARLGALPSPVARLHNGALLLWHRPLPGRRYILAADVAEGRRGGDFSAAELIDAVTGLQCAELMARWPLWRFAAELDRLGREYNAALLAVERNNHGHAVLHALRREHAYPRIYRHIPAHHAGAGRGVASVLDGVADGWPTNAQTKPQAVGALAAMLRDASGVFASARLLEQCRRFSWRDDGGMSAAPGGSSGWAGGEASGEADGSAAGAGHDDLVMAMAIALAVRERSVGAGADVELLSASR